MALFYSSLFLHLIGAAIWVGGHLVLAIGYLPEALKNKNVGKLQDFENKFEKIGIPALIVQVVTGLYLSFRFQPDWGQWFDLQSQFRGIGFKLTLLFITFILAIDARFRVIPKLTNKNIVSLAWHIIPVTVLGVLFVVIGAFFRIGGI